MTRPLIYLLAACLGLGLASTADAQRAPRSLQRAPSLQTPSVEEVRTGILTWFDAQQGDAEVRDQAEALWDADLVDPHGHELLERVARTVALVDPRARELVELCARPRGASLPPPQDWLFEVDWSPIARDNLRLLYGRWLSHEQLYDESLAMLADLAPENVVDPAALLFHQAVAYHRLLDKQAGLDVLDRLLDDVVNPPQRYKSLADLMRRDLQALEEESLDHIARRMQDIRRRLKLGHADRRVIEIEDGVIESLDKLIEELEQQQQQQQQSASASGSNRTTEPSQDSRILGGGGAGEVDKRPIGNQAGWGALPPKDREEALQQIGKEFPSHYRDVIEQYFRKLATEERPAAGE